MRPDYRPDIDGLRAIAVLAVVGYHYGVLWLPGGFVGVDVFFVISGYLITKIIKDRSEEGRFSFREFYVRRAQRLMPALLVVTLLALAGGFLIFSPELMQSLARSAIASTLAISNILFWREADYFDVAARLKPLLHTWSLSVEWQFYAVWPVFLAIGYRWGRGLVPWLIAAAGVISFLANLAFQEDYFTLLGRTPALAWIADGRATIFYNMPFRGFEFAAGALLLWLPAIRRNFIAEITLVLGLAGIAYCFICYHTTLMFPSWNGLLPTAATALAIHAGQSRFVGLSLRNPLAAYIGRVSYSIYLVHWPLIVFTEYYLFRPLSAGEAQALAAISLVVGIILHHAIELPFTMAESSPTLVASATTAVIVVVVSTLATANGFAWRINSDALGIRSENVTTLVSKEAKGRIGCDTSCEFGAAGGVPILVFGDSHMDHHTKALDHLGGDRFHFSFDYAASCFFGRDYVQVSATSENNDRLCDEARKTLGNWLESKTFSAIIVGELWSGYRQALHGVGEPRDSPKLAFATGRDFYLAALRDIANRLAGFQGKIVFMGRAPNTNLSCYVRPRFLPFQCPKIVDLAEFQEFREAFKEFAASTNLNVAFVDVAKTICPNDECRLADEVGHPLYTDAHHLSVYGSRLVVPQILSQVVGP